MRRGTPGRLGGVGRLACIALCALASGCTTVAQVTTFSNPACHEVFLAGLTGILVEQKEDPQAADRLAIRATEMIKTGYLGPRPFMLGSLSGADYSFFVELKDNACLLRLYGRQKGFVSYTNNLTYIATRPLTACQCAE
jgi:hypothetical protein